MTVCICTFITNSSLSLVATKKVRVDAGGYNRPREEAKENEETQDVVRGQDFSHQMFNSFYWYFPLFLTVEYSVHRPKTIHGSKG